VYWQGSFDAEQSASMLRRARGLAPERTGVLTLSAELELHFGNLDAACDYARKALGIDEGAVTAYVVIARASASSVSGEMLQAMIRLAARPELKRGRRRSLLNAIGRVCDALGEYDRAFDYFSRANALSEGQYDRARREASLAQAGSIFDAQFVEVRKSFGSSGTNTIFIIGMPRSGSTLLEQALVAHPRIDSCGESDAVSAINRALFMAASDRVKQKGAFSHLPLLGHDEIVGSARAYLDLTSAMKKPQRTHQLDKRLSNFLHLPLIGTMFPDARFLHAHRHPLDLCLSCYMQDFDGHFYTNDLGDLAHFYGIYCRYMQLWSGLYGEAIRHCSYERFIASPETETRAALAFAGLEWNEGCAAPHLVERFVATSSAAQVRAPVHGKSVARWRHYEKHLKPLIDGLGGHDAIEKMRDFWS
jgi:tetratricopeptide (TPR) repeat protein